MDISRTCGAVAVSIIGLGMGSAAPAWASESPLVEPADLAAFLDGLVPYGMQRADIAGGVVVIVKDGRVLLAKGYGLADVQRRRPVIPAETLFRVGSITKVFTATAVMQQVERGRIDLDRDINAYTELRIPPAFGKPITLRQLLTHTTGFEESVKGIFATDAAQRHTLNEYVQQHLPARIYPPGQAVAYSNYGYALAGAIVERVTAESFESHLTSQVLRPLGMDRSTLQQPLPASVATQLASCYRHASSAVNGPFDLVEVTPAGALSATGADMAHFMIAHLQGGTFAGAHLLQPETVRTMHATQYTSVRGLNGYTLGFYEDSRNGRRIIAHSGDVGCFHSDLHLILDAGVGIFVAFNSTGRDGGSRALRTAVLRAFLDRYFPYSPPNEPTTATARADASRVAGTYLDSRRLESALRLRSLLHQIDVVARPDGVIESRFLLNMGGTPKQWREVGPLVYREAAGQARLIFVANEQGQIERAATDEKIPIFVLHRIPDWQRTSVVSLFVAALVVVFVTVLLHWGVSSLRTRRSNRYASLSRHGSQLPLLARLSATSALLAIVGWSKLIATLDSDGSLMTSGAADPWLYALYGLGVVVLAGTVVAVVNAVEAWRSPNSGAWSRTRESLIALALVGAACLILHFRLVSFSVQY